MKKINLVFEPAKIYFTILTDSIDVSEYLINVYRNMLVEIEEKYNQIILVKRNNDIYYIQLPNGTSNKVCDLKEVLVIINRFIKKSFKCDLYWPFHGGVVIPKENNGIILCGKSGAGKSTLCTHFYLKGILCPSDDLVWIHKDDFSIIPMPSSINLREDVIDKIELIKNNHKYSFPDIDGNRRWVLSNPNNINQAIQITRVININYNEKYSYLEELNTVEALRIALTNSYSAYNMRLNHEMATKMVKEFKFYQMYYTSGLDGIDQIQKLLEID
ncbi:hypothetical protein [Vallitalea guaymasensis]|uniref:hypothetical protein n=1 Tax=Vallitalea guaymasensis TaxID=1185412 RepID=UPI000DE2B00E|nr:hypothetical protein [Vallitalea guaymasensis]